MFCTKPYYRAIDIRMMYTKYEVNAFKKSVLHIIKVLIHNGYNTETQNLYQNYKFQRKFLGEINSIFSFFIPYVL